MFSINSYNVIDRVRATGWALGNEEETKRIISALAEEIAKEFQAPLMRLAEEVAQLRANKKIDEIKSDFMRELMDV